MLGQYIDKVPFFTHTSKDSVRKIYDYIYNDATIYLTRKKGKFDETYANIERGS